MATCNLRSCAPAQRTMSVRCTAQACRQTSRLALTPLSVYTLAYVQLIVQLLCSAREPADRQCLAEARLTCPSGPPHSVDWISSCSMVHSRRYMPVIFPKVVHHLVLTGKPSHARDGSEAMLATSQNAFLACLHLPSSCIHSAERYFTCSGAAFARPSDMIQSRPGGEGEGKVCVSTGYASPLELCTNNADFVRLLQPTKFPANPSITGEGMSAVACLDCHWFESLRVTSCRQPSPRAHWQAEEHQQFSPRVFKLGLEPSTEHRQVK